MILSKQDRIKYLGFDDRWFMFIGILVLGLLTTYLFNSNILSFGIIELVVNYTIAIFFSFCNWSIMRGGMIYLRKKFPDFSDNIKRLSIVFILIIVVVLFVDQIGEITISLLVPEYNAASKNFRMLLPILLISIMTIAIYEAIYFYGQLHKSIKIKEKNKRAIVQSQLDALQNQSKPHFLFNSLNTLRDIIDQESKEDAKHFVDRLSNVYRFILESGNENLITLRQEVNFGKSYIHIQSERFGDNLKVEWNVDESLLDTYIAPMSLQLLLENAIKHNIISKANPLSIFVNVQNNQLEVKNDLQLKSTKLPSTKLGLKNIEQRYELLSGKEISIDNDGQSFTVKIPLLKSSDQKSSYANTDH